MTVTKPQLQILQHSMGVDEHGRGRQYRNHFVTGPGGDDFANCLALTSTGLMQDHGPQTMMSGMHCFQVTEAGRRVVAEQSPAPPKTSKAHRRYLAWLRLDGVHSFREFLTHPAYADLRRSC